MQNNIWCTHVGQDIPVLVYALLMYKSVFWSNLDIFTCHVRGRGNGTIVWFLGNLCPSAITVRGLLGKKTEDYGTREVVVAKKTLSSIHECGSVLLTGFFIFWPVGGSSAETPHGHFGPLILYDLVGWGAAQQRWTNATTTNWSNLRLRQQTPHLKNKNGDKTQSELISL